MVASRQLGRRLSSTGGLRLDLLARRDLNIVFASSFFQSFMRFCPYSVRIYELVFFICISILDFVIPWKEFGF